MRNIFAFELSYDPIPDNVMENWSPDPSNEEVKNWEDWMEKNNGGNPDGRATYFMTFEGMKKNAWITNLPVQQPLFLYVSQHLKLHRLNQKYNIRRQWMYGSERRNIHTDLNRSWGLFYVIDAGGSNVTTSWYIEPGQPLVREYSPELSKIDDCRKYDKVFEIKLEPKVWYFFNAAILHTVENAESIRSILYVGFNNSYVRDLKDIEVL